MRNRQSSHMDFWGGLGPGQCEFTGPVTQNNVTGLTGTIPIKLRTLLSWIREDHSARLSNFQNGRDDSLFGTVATPLHPLGGSVRGSTFDEHRNITKQQRRSAPGR